MAVINVEMGFDFLGALLRNFFDYADLNQFADVADIV